MFKKTFKKVADSLVSFVYPQQCLHCQEELFDNEGLLCEGCSSLLELLKPDCRCHTCFSTVEHERVKSCRECRQTNNAMHRVAACFDYIGPAASIVKSLKYFDQPHLATGAAAFMVAQFSLLDWPFPDVIVPVPTSLTRWLDRGYNQSALLAKEISKLLEVPTVAALRRRSGDFSQAGLSYAQRKTLASGSFQLKKPDSIKEMSVLLIDDVYTTGTTLRCSAEALCAGFPSHIYGLTLCKTPQE